MKVLALKFMALLSILILFYNQNNANNNLLIYTKLEGIIYSSLKYYYKWTIHNLKSSIILLNRANGSERDKFQQEEGQLLGAQTQQAETEKAGQGPTNNRQQKGQTN
jgi:hypothetical protein